MREDLEEQTAESCANRLFWMKSSDRMGSHGRPMGGSVKTRFSKIQSRFLGEKYIVETFSRMAERRDRSPDPIAAKRWAQLPKLSALDRFAGSALFSPKKETKKSNKRFVTVSKPPWHKCCDRVYL